MNDKFRDEIVVAMFERTIKRLWVLCIILIALLALTNGAWIWYESQFEDTITTTVDADQDGNGVNVVGGGDVNYGAESKDNNNPDKTP
jgi:hypothetical protein